MNNRFNTRLLGRFSFALAIVALIVLGLMGTVALAAPATLSSEAGTTLAGHVVTQTFTLAAGWNTIYLEVEPDNPSPLVDPDGDGPLPSTPSLSTIEAVFANLSCSDCLESVWTWHTPLSRMDYIVDPSEGLWDVPGWDRYFPTANVGDDGASREFLTTLLTLHANTGYLVKLRDDLSGSATLQVTGRPVVGHRRWAKSSFNLVGFPLVAGGEPTVALLKSTSVISDVLKLGTDGRWQRLADGTTLQSGKAYLAYYQETTAREDYTAPLDLREVASDGLTFMRGAGGNTQSVQVENLSAVTVTVAATLVNGASSGVALRYVITTSSTVNLRTNSPVMVTVGPGKAKVLTFMVAARDQRVASSGLLEISSALLGTRWLIPLTTATGSYGGLWVGDVVVNDVSEGRLGATNVASGTLTIALQPRDNSATRGATVLVEASSTSVALTTTLALTSTTEAVPLDPLTGTMPYVAGYVYADINQNGQRDATEQGFAGVAVRLSKTGTTITDTTDATGAYLFTAVAAGTYALTLTPAAPVGHTGTFTVTPAPTQTLPITATLYTMANALPVSVTVTAAGISDLGPATYKRMALPSPYTLPLYDATGDQVEPMLNFGFVPAYDVSLWTGTCSDRLVEQRDLGQAVNGVLHATLPSAALNTPPTPVTYQLLGGSTQYVIYVEQMGGGGAAGQGIACGEIAVGAPTKMADGRGSEFTFRVLLRVAESGRVSLLPSYAFTETLRISSVAFSHPLPITATATFTASGQPLIFPITVAANDPLNPFKHKYQPDHDNLDTEFNAIDPDTTPSYLLESPEVQRRITLELADSLPYAGATADEAIALDWGGANWGGYYREVIHGLHKNDITVKGYFVIRQILTADQLVTQEYDQP